VTGVQTCALPISQGHGGGIRPRLHTGYSLPYGSQLSLYNLRADPQKTVLSIFGTECLPNDFLATVVALTAQKTSSVALTVAEQQTINIPPIVACTSATEDCLQVVA
jgi:hypothetical protein